MTIIVDIDQNELQQRAFKSAKQIDYFIIGKLKEAGIPINYSAILEKNG
jgi:hypothetical protein